MYSHGNDLPFVKIPPRTLPPAEQIPYMASNKPSKFCLLAIIPTIGLVHSSCNNG
ncbi:hypothetical protein J6W20_02790 [bacterium]|nr:hypothetical protein [bacterium]